MDDCFIEFKKRLKLIKKDLEESISICEVQLSIYAKLTDKANAIKFGRENDINQFNFKDIDKELSLIQESIKYSNMYDKIIKMLNDKKISLPIENITFNGGRYLDNKVYFRNVKKEEILDILNDDNKLDYNDKISRILIKYSNGDGSQISKLTKLYLYFNILIMITKEYVKDINNLIISIDNDKIKAPIDDINILYSNLILLRMSSDDINKILGSAILFNKKYAIKNKKHNINNINLIIELSKYYDKTLTGDIYLELLLKQLKNNSIDYFRKILLFNNLIWLINGIDKDTIKSFYLKLPSMKYINKCIINSFNSINESNEISDKENKKISSCINDNDIEFYKYLKLYYKNGKIINIPENIDEFYFKLDNSCLDIKEKNFIKSLLEEKITKIKNENKLSFLSDNDKMILEKATMLLSFSNFNKFDINNIRHILDDIKIILDMLNEELYSSEKDELLNELNMCINNLELICNKYNETSKYIFLLNKDNNPYILDDIKNLDKSYDYDIKSLIYSINSDNRSNFIAIKNNKLKYQVYKYLSSKLKIVFLEIDSGIYLIMGIDKINGVEDKIINRLRFNVRNIELMEKILKDMNARDNLLFEHEGYLDSIGKNDVKRRNISKK